MSSSQEGEGHWYCQTSHLMPIVNNWFSCIVCDSGCEWFPCLPATIAIPCAVCPRFSGLPPPLNAPRGPVFSHSHGCDHRSAVFGDKIGSAPQKPQASCTLEHTGEVYYYWSKCEASGVHAPYIGWVHLQFVCGHVVVARWQLYMASIYTAHTHKHTAHTHTLTEREGYFRWHIQAVSKCKRDLCFTHRVRVHKRINC